MMEFDRSQIKAVIQEVLAEMLGMSDTHTQAGWVSLKDAVSPLGYPSYKALHKDVCADGVFRLGKEVRDRRKPGAKLARLQINIELAQRRLGENPANRRSI
jgi:hypothetical protein